ncbi:hypothetical protein PG995_007296 [Apiospora arundinis]
MEVMLLLLPRSELVGIFRLNFEAVGVVRLIFGPVGVFRLIFGPVGVFRLNFKAEIPPNEILLKVPEDQPCAPRTFRLPLRRP